METKIHVEYINEWVQTDASCNQYRKYISDTTFLFKEDRIINPETKETEVYESEIDINDYDEKNITSMLASYGYNKELDGYYYDSELNRVPNEIIAECIFEMEN